MNKATFRLFIALSLLSVISAITYSTVKDYQYPDLIQQFLDASENALTWLDWISLVATLIAFCANISLLFFSNIGRFIYVICIPFTLIVPGLSNETVITNQIEDLLFGIDTLMTGLVIALCYFSSASDYFQHSK
ncbi:hypothetical protein C1E23_01515 [Pseudoalteromonas phenolica]|uniref:Uncharacterized protein n=1 Tax=Pseudoalteromonas phenolica TaxID=161398 RepID=A0A4Q7IR01_9GAMM|nr:hypothetical protein [Pseudoalteromonas phenolica]RZQ54883.1 hypothetical protein C1E23_01515 [Pseudoalteromonas phenolica]